MGIRSVVTPTVAYLLVGCEAMATIVVQVRTDLVPGTELGAVEVELDGEVARVDAAGVVDWGRGVRILERAGIPTGRYALDVRALDPAGGTVVRRPLRVDAGPGVNVATVLLTRDCAGVACPDAADAALDACFAGRCVPGGCAAEVPSACGELVCATDADCPAPTGADCARGECVAGGCFVELDHAACGGLRCTERGRCGEPCVADAVPCEAGLVCDRGLCAAGCEAPRVACDGACRDLDVDLLHCGGCAAPCSAPATCALGACVVCGDARCDGAETCAHCTADCLACPSCGDFICEASLGESCEGCPIDCC